MDILSDPELYITKEKLYFDVRNKEGRIISDDELKKLPYVDNSNPFKKEWDLRTENFDRFIKYLSKTFNRKSISILDIGCGNGWMTHRLNEKGHNVTGLDLNMEELQQAERTFGNSNTLHWVYADILKETLPNSSYDIILFSASCQYFEDIQLLTSKLLTLLAANGEIHLTDSIFYPLKEVASAKSRSEYYYNRLGYPEMSNYYFHHSIESLKKCGYKKQYPGIFANTPLQWWKRIKT